VDAQAPLLEPVRRRGHVETPDAVRVLAGGAARLVAPRLEPPNPVAERDHVMLAQALDVAELEAGGLGRRQRRGDWDQLAVREDVALRERAPAPSVVSRPAAATRSRASSACRSLNVIPTTSAP
jgi:hypothetical protein